MTGVLTPSQMFGFWILFEGQWEAFEGTEAGIWHGEAGALESSFWQPCGDWSRRDGNGERQTH